MNLITVKKEFEEFFKKFKSIDNVNLLMEFLDLTVSEYKKDPSNLISFITSGYKNEKLSIKRLSKTKKGSLVKFIPLRVKKEKGPQNKQLQVFSSKEQTSNRNNKVHSEVQKNSQDLIHEKDDRCVICHSNSMFGHRYGIDCCEPCFKFFLSNVPDLKSLKCVENGNCKISVKSKDNCKKCYLERFFKAGLNKKIEECELCERLTMHKTLGLNSCHRCSWFIRTYMLQPLDKFKCSSNDQCYFDKDKLKNCIRCRLRKLKDISIGKNNKS